MIALVIVQFEQHAVRVVDENLLEIDRDDMVLAMRKAEPVELGEHRIMALAGERDVMDGARIPADIDVADRVQRARHRKMEDRAAFGVEHPLDLGGIELRRRVAGAKLDYVAVEGDRLAELHGLDVDMIEAWHGRNP